MNGIRTQSIDRSPGVLDADVLTLLRDGFPEEPVDLLAVELARARHSVNGFGYLALHDHEIIGVLTGHHRDVSVAFLVYLTVVDSYRRRGVARSLLEPFDGQHLTLYVACSNRAAQDLYRRGGLRPTRRATQRHDVWSGTWRHPPRLPDRSPSRLEDLREN